MRAWSGRERGLIATGRRFGLEPNTNSFQLRRQTPAKLLCLRYQ